MSAEAVPDADQIERDLAEGARLTAEMAEAAGRASNAAQRRRELILSLLDRGVQVRTIARAFGLSDAAIQATRSVGQPKPAKRAVKKRRRPATPV